MRRPIVAEDLWLSDALRALGLDAQRVPIGPGDDAAWLRTGGDVVVTTDVIVLLLPGDDENDIAQALAGQIAEYAPLTLRVTKETLPDEIDVELAGVAGAAGQGGFSPGSSGGAGLAGGVRALFVP